MFVLELVLVLVLVIVSAFRTGGIITRDTIGTSVCSDTRTDVGAGSKVCIVYCIVLAFRKRGLGGNYYRLVGSRQGDYIANSTWPKNKTY